MSCTARTTCRRHCLGACGWWPNARSLLLRRQRLQRCCPQPERTTTRSGVVGNASARVGFSQHEQRKVQPHTNAPTQAHAARTPGTHASPHRARTSPPSTVVSPNSEWQAAWTSIENPAGDCTHKWKVWRPGGTATTRPATRPGRTDSVAATEASAGGFLLLAPLEITNATAADVIKEPNARRSRGTTIKADGLGA